MNSAPHLLNEDREQFARILDEALRTAEYRPDLASAGKRLNTEQLRTMALSATSAIAACATIEYERYVQLRAKLRSPSGPSSAAHGNGDDGTDGEEQRHAPGTGPAEGLVAAVSGGAEPTGAGLAAMLAVLVPVLAGISAVIFLLIGYILRGLGPDQTVAKPMISVGWVFAGLTAAAILVAMGGLVITALRNGSTSLRATKGGELAQEVDRAREAWRHALLERGVIPFLREALSDPASGTVREPRHTGRRGVDGESRIPTLGYSRPDFTSPEGGPPASPRPRFTSPDFTSPDYGGPDHRPD